MPRPLGAPARALICVALGATLSVGLSGCGDPEPCRKLRARVCDLCGAERPACAALTHKSDSAQRCAQTLQDLEDLLARLKSLPADEQAERVHKMCAANPSQE
jgi:hypothetical protein